MLGCCWSGTEEFTVVISRCQLVSPCADTAQVRPTRSSDVAVGSGAAETRRQLPLEPACGQPQILGVPCPAMCAADVRNEPVDGLNDECEAAAGAAGLDCGAAETVFPVLAGGADGIRFPQAVSLAGYRGICGPDARVGPLRGALTWRSSSRILPCASA